MSPEKKKSLSRGHGAGELLRGIPCGELSNECTSAGAATGIALYRLRSEEGMA